jgi:hypothetical protein
MKIILSLMTLTFSYMSWGSNIPNIQSIPYSEPKNSLDGTNLICRSLKKPTFPSVGIYGFRFIGSDVAGDSIVTKNDVVELVNFYTSGVAQITLTEVRWWSIWTLNRETLELSWGDKITTYQCRVMSDLNSYNNEMDEFRIKQEKIVKELVSEQLKKNKL